MNGFIGSIPQGTADTDAVVIPQIAADFANNHRDGIGGKFYPQCIIKIVNGLNQSDTSNLKEVINIFLISGKTFNHT